MSNLKVVLTTLGLFTLIFVFLTLPTQALAANPPVPILMYHYIGNNPNPADTARNSLSVSPDKFDAQMNYLKQNGYTPISLDDLYGIFHNQRSVPNKPIVLTFDDGYIDFYHNAYPILRKYNFKAVQFIPSGLMNQGYYLHWSQIKEMHNSGLITFEGHSITHANLVSLNQARLLSELKDSKAAIQAQTGYPVNFVAYPMGISNNLVHTTAKKAGYVGGVGTWKGKASFPSMNMPRIRISGYMNLAEFAKQL